MPYSTVQDVIDRFHDCGHNVYFDSDGDDYLDTAEQAKITNAIVYADAMIDGRLRAGNLKVIAAGTIVKDWSVNIAIMRKVTMENGDLSAWASGLGEMAFTMIDEVVAGRLRFDTEIGPLAAGEPGPVVSNPKISTEGGLTWPDGKTTKP